MIIFLVGKDSFRATTNSIKGIELDLCYNNGIYASYLTPKMLLRKETEFNGITFIRAGIA
jgi:hypothetical protein